MAPGHYATGVRDEPGATSDRDGGRSSQTVLDILPSCIFDSTQNLLGEGCARALMFHLNLAQHARDAKEFHYRLSTLLKDGAITLERVVVKDLFHRLGLPFSDSDRFNFVEHVKLANNILVTRAAKLEILR